MTSYDITPSFLSLLLPSLPHISSPSPSLSPSPSPSPSLPSLSLSLSPSLSFSYGRQIAKRMRMVEKQSRTDR